MDLATIFLLVAVVVFAAAAFLGKNLVAAGLAFFAAAFLVKVL
jgi:hypothetical protein